VFNVDMGSDTPRHLVAQMPIKKLIRRKNGGFHAFHDKNGIRRFYGYQKVKAHYLLGVILGYVSILSSYLHPFQWYSQPPAVAPDINHPSIISMNSNASGTLILLNTSKIILPHNSELY